MEGYKKNWVFAREGKITAKFATVGDEKQNRKEEGRKNRLPKEGGPIKGIWDLGPSRSTSPKNTI